MSDFVVFLGVVQLDQPNLFARFPSTYSLLRTLAAQSAMYRTRMNTTDLQRANIHKNLHRNEDFFASFLRHFCSNGEVTDYSCSAKSSMSLVKYKVNEIQVRNPNNGDF